MQIVFHIGAHVTDEGRLMRSLLKNREMLAEQNILIPGPGRYRKTLRDVMTSLRGERASAETRDVVLEAVNENDSAERIILFNDSFICMPNRAIEDGMLYARAGKAAWLRNIFPDDEVEFCVGLRNIATFVPALYDKLGEDAPLFQDFTAGFDPFELCWADYLARLAASVPGCRITAWCNEDTPFIWPEVMREVSDTDPLTPLDGGLDVVMPLLDRASRKGLESLLSDTPPETEAQRRQIIADHLEAHAIEEELVEEIDLPGWPADLIEELTEVYDEDLTDIADIPGVTLITP